MSRAMIIVLAVMLVSSSALAHFVGVEQTQSYLGAISNTVDVSHGINGRNIVSLDIENRQKAVDTVNPLLAKQSQHSALMQVGKARARRGHVSVLQNLGSAGDQIQRIGGGMDPKYQSQTNALGGTQVVASTGGRGSGNALQVGSVRANQYGENAAGYMRQSSTIDSLQKSSYRGGPGDTGRVTSSVTGHTQQTQVIN